MMAPDRVHILEALKPALVRASNGRADVEALSEDALLIEDVGLASLDLLELRFELEDLWNTTLTDADTLRLRTIGNVIDVLIERGAVQPPEGLSVA
jgi:acyl carrier protein